MGILSKTLSFINDESLESEFQKHALLKIKRVREKINAANRKHDQLSKAISRSENDTNNRDQQLQRLLAYETEICDLETRLDELLDAETDRRQTLLTDRTTRRHREQPIVQNKEAKETNVTQDASPLSLSLSSSSNDDNNPAIRSTVWCSR